MAGIDHALEGIPRYAGFKYKKKKRAETCVFRRSFRLFAALFFSPRPSFAVQNFFCFLTIFFPQSHTHPQRALLLVLTTNRGSGIFKTAAIYVLRKEKRLLTTGQITRYIIKSEKEEREQKLFSFFFFSFSSNGPSFFLLGGACDFFLDFDLLFAFFCCFFIRSYFFFHFHIRDAGFNENDDERARERESVN